MKFEKILAFYLGFNDVLLDVEPNSDLDYVKFEGQGHFKYKTNTYADLYANIKIKEHPIYRKEGDDIHSDYYLTISEAILGKTLNIHTIHGKKKVEISPGINHGEKIILKGYGIYK